MKPRGFKYTLQRFFHRNYCQTWALKEWFKRRYSAGGIVVLIGMFVAGGLGVDTNLNLAYQAFSFFAVVLCLAMLLSFGPKPRFSARRALPRLATAGQTIEYHAFFKNNGSRLQRGFRVSEIPDDPRPNLPEFLNSREPLEHTRNLFDRTLAYFRWMWLIERKAKMRVRERPIPDVPAGEEIAVKMSVTPLKRGRLDLPGLRVACPDPIGLVRTFLYVRQPDKILVLPKRYPISPTRLPGLSQYQQGGVTLASSVGESEEFMALRDYRRGDPLRHIHWRSLGKTGRLIVKQYQDEFFVRQALVLDTFGPVADDRIFEEAVSVASSLALTVQSEDSLLDLMFVGPQAYCFTAGRGVGHVEQMLEILASVQIAYDKDVASLRSLVMQHAGSMSACWCVLLSWDEERQKLVQELRGLGIPVCVLVIGNTEATEEHKDQFHVLPVGKVEQALKKI